MPDYRSPVSPAANVPEHQRQSLATGFREVDRSGDTGACQRCLDLITGIPFFYAIKDESFRIIARTDPKRVLDAGCGAGSDLVSLASVLHRQCHLTGLDASGSLLLRAAERTTAVADRCSLIRGDVTTVPCRDGVFNACRIDRVLQHLHKPEQAIRELVRVTQPGGTLVAFDNDWDTFSISLDDQDMADRIRRFWRDSFASGRIGRDLPRILTECGFEEIHVGPRTLMLTDRPLAEQVFDLPVLLERMAAAGVLTRIESVAIRDELHRRAHEGTFSSGYTGFIVWGKKPE